MEQMDAVLCVKCAMPNASEFWESKYVKKKYGIHKEEALTRSCV